MGDWVSGIRYQVSGIGSLEIVKVLDHLYSTSVVLFSSNWRYAYPISHDGHLIPHT
jgi:hypothetical protein